MDFGFMEEAANITHRKAIYLGKPGISVSLLVGRGSNTKYSRILGISKRFVNLTPNSTGSFTSPKKRPPFPKAA
jgi:hypothetical protein